MKHLIPSRIFHYTPLFIWVILQTAAFTVQADCDNKQCTYSITLDKAGFYVPTVKLPTGAKEGFWGLSLNTSSGLNEGGFNAGGVLGENATYPGFIGFYLTQPEKINIAAYEYTGKVKELTVSISDANKNFVLSPTAFKPDGEAKDINELPAGFYAASVYSKSGDPRGRFGISLVGKSFGGGVNVGGWIDSTTGGTGEGFGGVYVSTPQTVSLQILFGDSYGSVGAGRPNIEIYRQEPSTGVRVKQWSSTEVDTPVVTEMKKLLGTWTFLANSYPYNKETTITLATDNSNSMIVSGTGVSNSPVYVKYNSAKQRFYLYSFNGYSYSPHFWFHFVSDNAVSGCLTWEEISASTDPDYDCSLGGTLTTPSTNTAGNEPTEFQGIVAAHNAWRKKVGVPDLTWSDKLATFAQEWATTLQGKGCKMEHRPNNSYGENLYWSSGFNPTTQEVVDAWGDEVKDYNYATNTCATGKVCGHYTQVVWKDTTEVGCGKATCNADQVWVCNYNPPGNWVGQKPY